MSKPARLEAALPKPGACLPRRIFVSPECAEFHRPNILSARERSFRRWASLWPMSILRRRCWVQSQRGSEQIERRIRLFDDSQNRRGIGDGERARFASATEFPQKLFELAGEIFRRSKFLRDRTRREAGENEARIAFAPKSYTLKDVLSQIDADNRIRAFRHDARRPCSGKRALRWRFLDWRLCPSCESAS